MKNTRSKRNIVAGYALSLLVLTCSSVMSYLAIGKLLDITHWVDHTNVVIIKLEEVISSMKDAETGQRGFLLTDAEEFLEPYRGAKERVRAALDSVEYLTVDNGVQQLACDTLRKLVNEKNDLLAAVIASKRASGKVNLDSMRTGKMVMDQVRKVVQRMQDREVRLLEARTRSMEKYAGYTNFIIVAASLLAICITILFYRRIKKDNEMRAQLEQQLVLKEEDTTRRIAEIDRMAGKIAEGDYTRRIGDDGPG